MARFNRIKQLIKELDALRRSTLKFCVKFFEEVVSHESDNKMTSYNIAVTVSPNIFRSRENASADIFSHAIIYEAFISMIENYEYFFEESSRCEAALTHNAVGKLEGF